MKALHRLHVTALIVRDGRCLLSAYQDGAGRHYRYPGGGVEPEESAHEAVRRLVHEQTGADVTDIGRLLLVWEQQPSADQPHMVGLVFECAVADYERLRPSKPDGNLLGTSLQPLEQLLAEPVLPWISQSVHDALQSQNAGAAFVKDI